MLIHQSWSLRASAIALTLVALTQNAEAQWGPFGNNCNCQPAVAPAAAAPIYGQVAMANPCNPCAVQSVSVAQCVQPVQETVYQDVPVVKYRQETRTIKEPVVRTVYEEKPVTAYRQVMVQKTAEVPSVQYQTVTECQQQCINNSRWVSVRQPVQKGCACDYDRRPGLLGWMNRQSYEMRMAFTPNYITQRHFVPDVRTVSVPVQRTVAVPTTRQVTYNVAQMEAYETTQRVARQITEYEEKEVTVQVPYTETKTVAVGTRTRYAYVDQFGGSSSTTALNPTTDRTAEAEAIRKKKEAANNTGIQLNSYEQPSTPTPATNEPAPFSGLDSFGQNQVKPTLKPEETTVGWRPSRRGNPSLKKTDGPALPVIAAN
ncbi:MAG: hypothetical protein KDA52_15220 [Planctomycetaceae bacterium]|nr:hypothetical protein [Planctomycetaceae bacterium]